MKIPRTVLIAACWLIGACSACSEDQESTSCEEASSTILDVTDQAVINAAGSYLFGPSEGECAVVDHTFISEGDRVDSPAENVERAGDKEKQTFNARNKVGDQIPMNFQPNFGQECSVVQQEWSATNQGPRIYKIYVSAPGYNCDKTRAIIYLAGYCGEVCGHGAFLTLEYSKGAWTVTSRTLGFEA